MQLHSTLELQVAAAKLQKIAFSRQVQNRATVVAETA